MTEQEIHQFIEMNPFRGHKPIFKNTNITVAHIIDDLAKGMSFDDVFKEHPQLTVKHLQAAFVYCQISIKENEIRRVFNI